MLKQSIVFIDGRLLVFPLAFFVGGILTPGTTSVYFLITGAVLYAAAKALFMRAPWLIDDLQAEVAYDYHLSDIGDAP